jgi:hypothetical protein
LVEEGSGDMPKFSIGDRVSYTGHNDMVVAGDVGTVIEDHGYPCVHWDISRGSMYDLGEYGGRRCWAVRERYMELVEAVNKSAPVAEREW